MKRFLVALLTLILCLSLILVGCSQNSNKLEKISVGEVTHSVFYAPQYVAIAEGLFEKQGLEIDLLNTQGADKTMAALLSKEVQIGLMGPEASIYVYNQGSKDYAVNFAQLTQRDGSFLVSREQIDDFKFEDLKGKELLGGRKGGMPQMSLEYVLKKNGLTIGPSAEDVHMRCDIQFSVMSGAFAGGEGDFVTLFDPAATELEKQGKGHIVASIGAASGEVPYTCYSAPKSYISENKDTIQKFTNAIYEGQIWVQNHSAEEIAKSIQPFFTDLEFKDLETVVARYKSINAWAVNPTLEKENLNLLMQIMENANELDKRAPYEKIVTTEYSQNAINSIK